MGISKKSKKKSMLIFIAICLMVGVGVTLAYYFHEQYIDNHLKTNAPQVGIVEKFNPESTFLPGEFVEKRVKFTNSGARGALIRFKYASLWVDNAGNETACDPEMVNINWTKTDDLWTVMGDYIYYNKVLNPNESTEEIMDKVTLKPQVSNDAHAQDYSNHTFELKIDLESCQVFNEAANENFNVNVDLSNVDKLVWTPMIP